MKHHTKFTAILLALLLTVGLLTGCSASAAETIPSTDLVVVALQGSNMPSVGGALEPYLEEAVSADTGSSFTLIVADGTPFQAGRLSWDERTSLNQAHWKEEKADRAAQAQALMASATAQTPETDLLGGLDMAARAAKDGTADQQKLVIVHNGIPTAGALSFLGADLASLDEATIQTLVARLQEQQALPDLSGVEVTWLYLGEGCAPQETVSPQIRTNLQTLWQTILEGCGAQVTFKTTLPDTDAVEGAPAVTPVTCSKEQTTLPDLEEPVALDPAAVGFEPDSAELTDPAATAEFLAPYAQAICRSDDGNRYVVAGSTADTAGSTAESSTRFGLQRARAVCEVLTKALDVQEDRLVAVGIGNLPTSVRSESDQDNRSVWLANAASDLGRELLQIGLKE